MTKTPRGHAVSTATVFCVRCDATYELGFNAQNMALSPKCPRCKHNRWSRSNRADVEAMCANNVNAVRHVVKLVSRRLPEELIEAIGGKDELVAEGMVGMLHHAHCYNPNLIAARTGKPVAFNTYLIAGLPRLLFEWINRQLRLGANGRPQFVEGNHWIRATAPHLHLDVFAAEDPFHVADQRASCPLEAACKAEQSDLIRDGMKKLDPRHRKVLNLRKIKGMTLVKVSVKLGICKERVRQMELEAMATLVKHWNVDTPEAAELLRRRAQMVTHAKRRRDKKAMVR